MLLSRDEPLLCLRFASPCVPAALLALAWEPAAYPLELFANEDEGAPSLSVSDVLGFLSGAEGSDVVRRGREAEERGRTDLRRAGASCRCRTEGRRGR